MMHPYIWYEASLERGDMAAKAERVEARLKPVQRQQIEQAAALSGESVSGFMVLAALERAESVVMERATTVWLLITSTDWSPHSINRMRRLA